MDLSNKILFKGDPAETSQQSAEKGAEMKIATSLFLLVILILGIFSAVGYMARDMASLRSELETKNAEIINLQTKLTQLQTRVDQLTREKQDVTALVQDLQNKLAEAQTTTDTLREQVAQLTAELKSAQANQTETQAKLEHSQADFQQVTADLTKTRSLVDQAVAEIGKVNTALQNTSTERDQLRGELAKRKSPDTSLLPLSTEAAIGLPGGILIILASLLGYRAWRLPRKFNGPSSGNANPEQGPVTITMGRQSYHEFQAYLRSRKP
jgi:uncharacterized phage infection (PIP) family protein YhgE